MSETLGNLLRNIRIGKGVRLRELARNVGISAGYLSDVENDHVPPPSEAVILDLAVALHVDKDHLLCEAKKMDPELSSYISRRPQAADFLRMTKNRNFSDEDWERLRQLARLAKLGEGEEGK